MHDAQNFPHGPGLLSPAHSPLLMPPHSPHPGSSVLSILSLSGARYSARSLCSHFVVWTIQKASQLASSLKSPCGSGHLADHTQAFFLTQCFPLLFTCLWSTFKWLHAAYWRECPLLHLALRCSVIWSQPAFLGLPRPRPLPHLHQMVYLSPPTYACFSPCLGLHVYHSLFRNALLCFCLLS